MPNTLKKLTTTILMLLVIVSGFTIAPKEAEAAWYSSSWPYRFSITVDNTKVDADLTDFPVYLNLADLGTTHNFWGHVNSDGSDIRITTSDGTTEVAREVATSTFSTSSKTGAVYFKAPTLANSSDTVFYVYYGNAGATEPNANATYGKFNTWNSNYKGVWHVDAAVNNNTDGYPDSTSNGNHMTGVSMALTEVAGKLAGKAQDYDGTNDYLKRTDTASLDIERTSPISITAWVKRDVTAAYHTIFSKLETGAGTNRGIFFPISSGNQLELWLISSYSSNYLWAYSSGTITDTSNFHHLAATYSGNSLVSGVHLYIDGSSQTVNTGANTLSATILQNGDARIAGRYDISTQRLDGKTDEIRIATTEFSSTWISTEYNNQSSSSTFYSLSAESSNFVFTRKSPNNLGLVGYWSFNDGRGTVATDFSGSGYSGTLTNMGGTSSTYDADWFDQAWGYRTKITVDNTKVNADLTNFPVYVDMSNFGTSHSIWSNMQALGADIRVTTSDGVTEVGREIATTSRSGKTGALYFNAPSLSSSTDTDFYIYYGNSSAQEPIATAPNGKYATWNSNYRAVWHLEQDPSGTTLDSTRNGFNLAQTGSLNSTDSVTGKLAGNGVDFNGTNQWLFADASNVLSAYPVTYTSWGKPNNLTAGHVTISLADNAADIYYIYSGLQGDLTGDVVRYAIRNSSTALDDNAVAYSSGAWNYLAGRVTSSVTEVFLNGVSNGTTAHAVSFPPLTGTKRLAIGALDRATNYGFFNGTIDEARIAAADLGSTWISTEYNNQNSPSTFYATTTGETLASVIKAGATLNLDASTTDHLFTTYANPTPSGTPSDGNAIQVWTDDTGLDRAMEYSVSGPTSPDYRATGINSLGSIDFNGTNDRMSVWNIAGTTTIPISSVISNSAYTIFTSFRMTGAASNSASAWLNDAILSDGNGSSSGGFFGLHATSSGGINYLYAYNYDGSVDTVTKEFDLNTDYVVMARHESGNLCISINNGTESCVASGNTNNVTNQLNMGVEGYTRTNYWDGYIGEVLIYNTALSGTDLTDTYQYMMDKWVSTPAGGDVTGWTSGKRSKALDFDGTDDYVSIGAGYNGVKSVAFWIKADNTTKKILDLNGTATVEVSSGTITANNFTSPTIYVDGAVSSTIDTDWHHVVITTDTGINASAIDLGRISSGYFDGKLDEVRMYSRALSATEVKDLYGSGTYVLAGDFSKQVATGLAGYWTFDGPKMLSNVADSSSSGYNGYLLNQTPTTTAIGKVGQALDFDGTDDYISIGAGYNGVKSVAFWIKADSTTKKILDLNGTATVEVSAGTITANNFTSPTIYVDGAVTSTIDTNWHHVVITTDTGLNASAIDLGRISSGYFDGKLDEVRMYSNALTATEVKQLYGTGRSTVRP